MTLLRGQQYVPADSPIVSLFDQLATVPMAIRAARWSPVLLSWGAGLLQFGYNVLLLVDVSNSKDAYIKLVYEAIESCILCCLYMRKHEKLATAHPSFFGCVCACVLSANLGLKC